MAQSGTEISSYITKIPLCEGQSAITPNSNSPRLEKLVTPHWNFSICKKIVSLLWHYQIMIVLLNKQTNLLVITKLNPNDLDHCLTIATNNGQCRNLPFPRLQAFFISIRVPFFTVQKPPKNKNFIYHFH